MDPCTEEAVQLAVPVTKHTSIAWLHSRFFFNDVQRHKHHSHLLPGCQATLVGTQVTPKLFRYEGEGLFNWVFYSSIVVCDIIGGLDVG